MWVPAPLPQQQQRFRLFTFCLPPAPSCPTLPYPALPTLQSWEAEKAARDAAAAAEAATKKKAPPPKKGAPPPGTHYPLCVWLSLSHVYTLSLSLSLSLALSLSLSAIFPPLSLLIAFS